MADQTIHDENIVTTAAIGDELLIWRVANNDTKRITKANFVGAILTGGGTLATGGFTLTVAGDSTINGSLVGPGFTLTVPATGTAGLLETAQTYTGAKTYSALLTAAAITASGNITANANLVASKFLILTSATATLASDAITATASLMIVDTEAAAATDTLSTINGGVDGALIIINQSNSSRDILINVSAGNIRNATATNRQMSDNSFHWMGRYKASVSLWLEVSWPN
jgi:hypothetical protein